MHPQRESQLPVPNGHAVVRGNDVHAIALYGHPILGFANRYLDGPGQDTGEHAVMLGIEVLHQDEGHAGLGRESPEKLGKRLQPSR